MHWIYLSPHFDDIALSCGGLVWEQVQAGSRVEIWTICAGDPPDSPLSPFAKQLHERWQTGTEDVRDRRQEDLLAVRRLGVAYRHFDWPDCIYRINPETDQPLIGGEEDLFNACPEEGVVHDLSELLKRAVPKGATLVCPVALGTHVDHLLTRFAAERTNLPAYYYADYPYILRSTEFSEQVEQATQVKLLKKIILPAEAENGQEKLSGPRWIRLPTALSEEALQAWQSSITAYRSQISTFWNGIPEMELAIRNYWAGGGGRLLQKIEP